jgi:hypothetical protein
VFIFLSYQQKPANPILRTRWGYRVINCSIAAGFVMKPTGYNVDAQRWIFASGPAFECVTCERKDNLIIPVRAMLRNFRTMRFHEKIIKGG